MMCCLLRELRDGISVLLVNQAGELGGPCYGRKWPNTCSGKFRRSGRPRNGGSGLREREMTSTARVS